MAKRRPEKLSALHFNGRERRNSPRVRYDIDAIIEWSEEGAGEKIEKEIRARLVDISLNGCSFISENWQPQVGRMLRVKLRLPEQRDHFLARVKVCSRLQARIGVEFVELDPASSSRLRSMLSRHYGGNSPPGFFSG